MKKPLVLLCVLLVSLSVLSAADSSVASISLMIDSDLFANHDAIGKESANLSDLEKMTLFSMHEDSPTIPFVVNLLVGGGIGSFIQGDTQGGFRALLTEVVGLGLYAVGVADVYSSAANGVEASAGGAAMVLIGASVLLGGRIYECIRPFSYSKAYNNQLHSALRGKAEIFVTPVITSVDNKMALGMVGKVSF